MSVQDIKDTFYAALRDRVAAGNASRTIVVRGTMRPAVLVIENELPAQAVDGVPMQDTFCMAWRTVAVDPLGMVKLGCEIRYATAGSTGAAGMDRGRALTAMDAELQAATGTPPQSIGLVSLAEIAGGGASTATPAGTAVFWTSATFGPTIQRNDRLERTALVEVFGYE